MHRKYPDPVVLPSPHSRGNQRHASADEKTGLLDGSAQQKGANQIDDYDLDVGLAGALK